MNKLWGCEKRAEIKKELLESFYFKRGSFFSIIESIIEEIEIKQYLKESCNSHTGRPRYNPVNMLKTILFGFMDTGYASLRELEDRCRENLRYMYLMDDETPSYRSFGYFINEELVDRIENIFTAIMKHITKTDNVDVSHIYIDGSKF